MAAKGIEQHPVRYGLIGAILGALVAGIPTYTITSHSDSEAAKRDQADFARQLKQARSDFDRDQRKSFYDKLIADEESAWLAMARCTTTAYTHSGYFDPDRKVQTYVLRLTSDAGRIDVVGPEDVRTAAADVQSATEEYYNDCGFLAGSVDYQKHPDPKACIVAVIRICPATPDDVTKMMERHKGSEQKAMATFLKAQEADLLKG